MGLGRNQNRSQQKRRWMDTIKLDMGVWNLMASDAVDWDRWRAPGAKQKPAT